MNTDTAVSIPQSQTPIAAEEISRVDSTVLAALLKSEYPNFPAFVIREVQHRRTEMIPQLIRLIEEASDNAQAGRIPQDMGHFLALPLLIEFRAEEALDAILRSVCLSDEVPDKLYGDATSEVLFRVVPALAFNRVDTILEVVRNPKVNEYVRWALIHGLRCLGDTPSHSPHEAALILQSLLREAIQKNDGSNATFITCEACTGGFAEILDDIRDAYHRDLIDEGIVGPLTSVEQDILERDSFDSDWRIVDTVDYMEDWYCFQPDKETERLHQGELPSERYGLGSTAGAPPFVEAFSAPESATIRYDEPHIGRNQPCPCGSGKKFKKCCARSKGLPEL